jgi:hypothetical protein
VSKRGPTIFRADAATLTAAPVVWLAGPWDEREFMLTRRALDPGGTWSAYRGLSDVVARIASGARSPEVVLLAQPRPGVDAQEAVDELQATAPLTRIVVVAGTWCEGELRTGRPPTGVLRLYWHELPAWWREAVAQRAAGRAPHWSTTPEQALDAARRDDAAAVVAATVAVNAIDYTTFEALEAALRAAGWACRWTPRGRGDMGPAALGIWDGGQLEPDEQRSLSDFCGRFPRQPAPVVTLVDFPRIEHLELVLQAGACGAIVGKPYRASALVDELHQAEGLTTEARRARRMAEGV